MVIDLAQVISQAVKKLKTRGEKVTRDAFLYLEPDSEAYLPERYAECETCIMWTGADRLRCSIHGKMLEVKGEYSCGLYVNGKPHVEMAGKEDELVTPEESGFTKKPVRCENCVSFDRQRSRCNLYTMLNKSMPSQFNLKENVKTNGCCNAQRPVS